MNNFIQYCNSLSPLNQEAINDLLGLLKTKTILKGNSLLKNGDVCKHLYFINEGLCKTLFYKEHKELIMQFFAENDMFTVLDSFLTHVPSTYTVMALEQTTCTFLHFSDLEELCQRHHCIETFFRKLVSLATIKMMKRIREMLEGNASEQYTDFLNDYVHILQRISLGDISNFIGITQVSLSRIRGLK